MSIFAELRRRNVFRVGVAYAVGAWLLLQLTEVLSELLTLPEKVGPVVVALVVIGLPITLILAWLYEMTPQGIMREKDVDRSQSITRQTGRKLDRTIIGVLAVAVAYLLVDKLLLRHSVDPVARSATEVAQDAAPDSPASVAVLPFVNMSNDRENEYFSDGLTETLLHMLAQLPDLRVAARTSSFAFKGENKSVADIAATLGVEHILEGSVQKSGDRVRVTAQLIRAQDGFHIWSQNYTRPLEDIFAIQDEIATDVASALDTSLLSANDHMHRVETTSLGAYELYLKAIEQQAVFSYGSLAEAEDLFKQALAEDPAFIDAKLGLVRNLVMMNDTGLIDDEDLQRQSEPLIAEVRSRQPDNRLAEALELAVDLRQQAVLMDPVQRDERISRLRSLIPLIPTESYLRQLLVNGLAGYMNRPEDALAVIEAGLLIDPLEPNLHASCGAVYMKMDRLEDALAAFTKANELDPRNPNHYSNLASISARMGDLRGKLNWYRKAAETDPEDHELAAFLAEQLYALGLAEEGDRWAQKVAILAPGSDVARKVELARSDAMGNDEQSLNLALQMIEDEVGDRRGAIGSAIYRYTTLMAEAGRSKEAVEYLVSREPNLLAFDQTFQSFLPIMMQWRTIGLMKDYLPAEEVLQNWEMFTVKMDGTGLPWKDEASNRAWDLVLRGETEEAARILIDEDFNRPLAVVPDRHQWLQEPMWREVAAVPEMAALISDREAEYQLARADIRQMLLEPEWNP